MAARFDLILANGVIVDKDGSAQGRCRNNRAAGSRNEAAWPGPPPRAPSIAGACTFSRRHRHPGSFPRAGHDPQGGSGAGQSRRRHGRSDRGLRDAQYHAADRLRRSPGRQAGAGWARMHCDYAFYVGATRDNAASLPTREASRLLRRQGLHGLLHGRPPRR